MHEPNPASTIVKSSTLATRPNSKIQLMPLVVAAFLGAMPALLTASPALATGPICVALFKADEPAVPVADLAAQAAVNYDSPNVRTYQIVEEVKTMWPHLATNEGPLLTAITEVLKDEELSTLHKVLGDAMTGVREDIRNRRITQDEGDQSLAIRRTLKKHLTEELSKLMAPTDVASRMEALMNEEPSKTIMVRALGSMTQKESLKALLGEGGINNVAADSVVGRYLQKAAALGVRASTYVGAFTQGPTNPERGERRLYISVDARTAGLAQEMFHNNPQLLGHNHTPQQNTLYLNHVGQNITYARYNGVNPINPFPNTIVPMLALSSKEASRTANYFELGRISEMARAKYPWALVDTTTAQEKTYCRPGGYDSCTHWFGEMAIGDKLTDKMVVPGQPDRYANVMDPEAADQQQVRVSALGNYTHFRSRTNLYPVGNESRVDRLTRMVWKEGVGHEQMWSMLGTPRALQWGELANPGWVLYTLLGPAKAERVPIVLIYRDNASDPLNEVTLDQLKESIAAY
jgi:hypothetical protein